MKNKILLLISSLLLIGLVSAINLYGGDNYSFGINFTNPVYTVTDNSSNLEGMNITFNGTHITISTQINMKPDNFTLIFIDNNTQEVITTVYVNSGGGHSHTITKVVNNTIIKIQDVPFYINNTCQNNTQTCTPITTVTPMTNKIPFWLWILLGLETLLLIILVLILILAKKTNDEIQMKGGNTNGRNTERNNTTKEED